MTAQKKMPAQAATRTSKTKNNLSPALYHRRSDLSREIRNAAADFGAVLLALNEAAAVYGIGAVCMYGAAVPHWLPASMCAAAATTIGALAAAAWKLFECTSARESRRMGTIPAEEICRIMKEGRR